MNRKQFFVLVGGCVLSVMLVTGSVWVRAADLNISTSNNVTSDISANGGDITIGSKTVTQDNMDKDGNYNSATKTNLQGSVDVKNGSLDVGSNNSGDADVTVGGDISIKDGSTSMGNGSIQTNVAGDVIVNTKDIVVDGNHERVMENGNVPASGIYDGRSVEREATTSRGKFYQNGAGEDGIVTVVYVDGSTLKINGTIRDGIIDYKTKEHHWHKNGERYGEADINGIMNYEGKDGKWSIIGKIVAGMGDGTRTYDGPNGEHFSVSGKFGVSGSGEFTKGVETWSQSGTTRNYTGADQSWSDNR